MFSIELKKKKKSKNVISFCNPIDLHKIKKKAADKRAQLKNKARVRGIRWEQYVSVMSLWHCFKFRLSEGCVTAERRCAAVDALISQSAHCSAKLGTHASSPLSCRLVHYCARTNGGPKSLLDSHSLGVSNARILRCLQQHSNFFSFFAGTPPKRVAPSGVMH